MKKALPILLASLGTLVLVGCATPNGSSTTANSQLGFTPVTTPEILVKWAQDFPNVKALETYVMAVPAETDEPVENLPEFSVNLPPGSVFVEPAGGEGPLVPYTLIRHTPHPR